MSSMANINDSKRRHCKFTVAWCLFKEFSSWLIPVKSQSQKAYCLLCCRVFSVSHSGLHDVKAHWKGKKHCFLQKQYAVNVNDSLEQYDIKAYSLIFNEELNRTEELRLGDVDGEKVESCELRSAFDDEVLAVTPTLYYTSEDPEDEEDDSMVKSATGAQQYCLRWKYHHNNLQVMFIQLLQRESFCDVTLACEGKMLRAHKVVLSACSTYFDKIFSEHEEKDPVVILKDCKFVDIKALVEFMYKGEINVENSHLNSLLKTAEELKIKGLADVSGKGLAEDDDSISYAPAAPPQRNEKRPPPPPAKEPPPPPVSREYPRDSSREYAREPVRDYSREPRSRDNREEEYDFDPSLLENSVSINDGSDIEEGTSQKAYSHHGDDSEFMESNNEHNFSTLISHLQDYRTAEDYANADREREREREREQREIHRNSANPYDNPVLAQFSDVIKMNDYLTTGRRQQFWEEPFTRRLMEAIKNKEIEMKAAAELMGVSYGTLYGRYRDAYGCLKHPYRTKDFWAEQGPAEILSRLQKKEITLFRAAEMLNVTVTTLANYLTTLRYEKHNSEKSEHDDDEEMDVNDSSEVYHSDPVPLRPKIDKAGSLSVNPGMDARLLGLHDEEM